MTQVLTPKLPGETVAYLIDFAHQLGDDWIESYTLVIDTGTVTISAQEFGSQYIRAVIAGGLAGETAELTAQIVTNGGQTLSRPVTLLIADDVVAVFPQTTTKRAIVEMAYEEATLAGYEFDQSPEEWMSALRRLDTLMAQWAASSLDLGYNFPAAIGQGDLDDEAGIPDLAVNAVAISLALRVYPTLGKTMSGETRVALAQGMVAVRAWCAVLPERSLANKTPIGAGNKPWSTYQPFSGVRRQRWR